MRCPIRRCRRRCWNTTRQSSGSGSRLVPFALASWIVFFANCAWFAWGLLHGVRIFYQPGSGPGASAQWRQVVMQIAAGVAAVGLLLGVIALRTSRSSRGQTYSALALNGSALAIYLVLLLS